MQRKAKTSAAMAVAAGVVATATVWAATSPETAKTAAAGAAKLTCSMMSSMQHSAGDTMSCCHMPMGAPKGGAAVPKKSAPDAKAGRTDEKMDGMAGMDGMGQETPKGTADGQGKIVASCAGM